MTLNDGTEIVHSELLSAKGNEYVKVCIERPVDGGFQSAVCYLPDHSWENIQGFSQDDISAFQELIESLAHVIIQLSKEGGSEGKLDYASSFY